jgi:hypothetical protein
VARAVESDPARARGIEPPAYATQYKRR